MNLIGLTIVLVALSSVDNTVCGQGESADEQVDGKLTDFRVCETIDKLHKYLPQELSPEAKCKRYAVLLYNTDGGPYETTVYSVLKLDDVAIAKQYKEMDPVKLSWFYMVSIDRYRITSLSPPFLDLINCLRMLGTYHAHAYLGNQELNVLENLYKKVLGLPGVTIDIDDLDFTNFNTPFQQSIRNLFGKYLDVDHLGKSGLSKDQTCLGSDPFAAAKISRAAITELQLNEKELESILEQREKSANRKRERSRLNQQRLRLFHPEKMRERGRKSQRKWELHRKQREWIEQASGQPEPESRRRRREQKRVLQKRYREKKRLIRQLERRHQVQKFLDDKLKRSNQDEGQGPSQDQLGMDPRQGQQLLPTLSSVSTQSMPFIPVASAPAVHIGLSGLDASLPVASPHNHDQSASLRTQSDLTGAEMPDGSFDQAFYEMIYKSTSDNPSTESDYQYRPDYQTMHSEGESDRGQNDDVLSRMQFFEPESEQERLMHQDLINSATQTDDTDTMMQQLLNSPFTGSSSADPQATNQSGSLGPDAHNKDG